MITLQDYSDDNSDTDLISSLIELDSVTVKTGDSEVTVDVSTKAHDTIWRMYRYAPLNCRDSEKYINRWKQRFSDIAGNMAERYNVLFKAYETYRLTGQLSTIDSVNSVTVNGGTTSNGDSTGQVTSEAIPQYADASEGEWLTGRQKSANTNSNTVQNYSEAVSKGIGGYIPAELVARIRNNSWNPYMEYAGEFSELFVPFYVDECGCSDYGGCCL